MTTRRSRRGGGIFLGPEDPRRDCGADRGPAGQGGPFIEAGTTTLEAKSGYGLDLDTELKMLRSIATVGSAGPLELVPTLLAAHAVPPEYQGKKDDYLKLVCDEIIPKAAAEGLARFVDVFCEQGWFSVEDAERVLCAGAKAGLKAKVHAEQITLSGGTKLAARLGAVSPITSRCAGRTTSWPGSERHAATSSARVQLLPPSPILRPGSSTCAAVAPPRTSTPELSVLGHEDILSIA